MNGTYAYTKIRTETLNELNSFSSSIADCRKALNLIHKECHRLIELCNIHKVNCDIPRRLKLLARRVFDCLVGDTLPTHVHSAINQLHNICMTPTDKTTVFCASNLIPL